MLMYIRGIIKLAPLPIPPIEIIDSVNRVLIVNTFFYYNSSSNKRIPL
jgi:hypothetical protein